MNHRRSDNPTMRRRILTKPFFFLLFLALVGLFYIIVRFTKGIGAVSNLSDGYPWGIWVAYDVAIGTAIACGGFAVAVLTYIMNRLEYHDLVRSAILTSLFGSFLAASSVVVDIGRPWNAYGFFVPAGWQPSSALFELALCVAGYLLAHIIEYLQDLLSPAQGDARARLRAALIRLLPAEAAADPLAKEARQSILLLRRRLNRVLFCIAVAGIILPTMHQSALGSLMLIASSKLHSLWHSPFLPLLFLINCLYIGYGMVIMESLISSMMLKRKYQGEALAELARLIPWLACAWLVVRVGDLLQRGQISAVFHGDQYSYFFLAEFFLMVLGSLALFSREKRRSPRSLFLSACLMLLGCGLYRFNVYLIGFNPGTGWHYFPSFAEIMISVGIVSLEIIGYQLLIKSQPPLSGGRQALN